MGDNFVKGVVAGMAAGAAIAMAIRPLEPRRARAMKRAVVKAIRAFGGIVDDIKPF